ncbi:hypothetical protein [Nocardiopsis chromatogenes]|uniref:hypothetical protein n=1 Tax=Nocardiopsis chromatogenes TaxID=280239 RepID=UPI0003491E65|nr:hypothetical protein [Nocardiopsis chromatogenes]
MPGGGAGGGGDDGGPAFDPVALADAARDAMHLPGPGLNTSPGADAPVLVQVPVWLWVDEEVWEPVTAEAEVPGGAVSVTATPTSADWSMGDGEVVTCSGPGRPYAPGRDDPASASPDCGHTYTRASTGDYTVAVEVTWSVSWEATDGTGGELAPLFTEADTEVDVVESQGLVQTRAAAL